MTDSVDRLYNAVLDAKGSDPGQSRTARLLRAGRSKIAKKLAEEAIEVVIDAMNGDRNAVVRESADLLYNLVRCGRRPACAPTRSERKWSGANGCSASPKSS
jgi:phosphoribosyl-ATP pyrophosphohydrolase